MKEIIRVERKRVLSAKIIILLIVIFSAFSIFTVAKNYSSYNIYDSAGNIIISAQENLTESKRREHNILLDSKALMDVVNGMDKSNYQYNMNKILLLLSTFPEQNLVEITNQDLERFYEQRIDTLESEALRPLGIFSEEQIEHLKAKASKAETPLNIGYAEGWKNLNNDMADLSLIVLIALSVILLPIFGQTTKTTMDELCNSMKWGKIVLIKAKLIVGFKIATIVYFLAIFLLTMVELLTFGITGYNLAIQSDIFYLFSACNITFLGQFLLNVLIGYIAIIFMASIVLLFTSITQQMISGAILTTFFWAIMIVLPKNLFTSFEITHNLSNFLPYNMTNFNAFYRNNEIYEVWGQMIPSYLWTIMVVLIVAIGIVLSTYIVATFKLSRK